MVLRQDQVAGLDRTRDDRVGEGRDPDLPVRDGSRVGAGDRCHHAVSAPPDRRAPPAGSRTARRACPSGASCGDRNEVRSCCVGQIPAKGSGSSGTWAGVMAATCSSHRASSSRAIRHVSSAPSAVIRAASASRARRSTVDEALPHLRRPRLHEEAGRPDVAVGLVDAMQPAPGGCLRIRPGSRPSPSSFRNCSRIAALAATIVRGSDSCLRPVDLLLERIERPLGVAGGGRRGRDRSRVVVAAAHRSSTAARWSEHGSADGSADVDGRAPVWAVRASDPARLHRVRRPSPTQPPLRRLRTR